jgi:hypothetical protein
VALVTGGSVLSLQVYLTRAYGDAVYDRVLDAMPAELAAPLRGIVMPVKWYPTEAFVAAIETAGNVLAKPDIFESYGAFAADFEIRTFQRIALRFTSPMYLMDRSGRMWRRYHDTGEWEVWGEGKRLRGTLRGFAIVNAHYCRVLAAWFKRAFEMTGVAGSTVVHPVCRAGGADGCTFEGWWS